MTAVARVIKTVRWVAGSLLVFMALATLGKAQGSSSVPGLFQVGDRIALTIEGPVTFFDTVVVREGLVFALPNVGDISVRGVRRADAQPYLTQQVGKYIKNAIVRAVALVRVGVFGAVGRPGYYAIPTDLLFGDILMKAGGPTGTADPNKMVVKRLNKVVVKEKQTQAALAAGRTVADVGILSNDVVEIGTKPQRNLTTYLQAIGVVLGIVGLAVSISRH